MLSVRGLTKIYANRFDAQAGGVRDIVVRTAARHVFHAAGAAAAAARPRRCVAWRGWSGRMPGGIAVGDRVLFDECTAASRCR